MHGEATGAGGGTGDGAAPSSVELKDDAVHLNGKSARSVDWNSGNLAMARSAGADGGHIEVTLTPSDWVFAGGGKKAVRVGVSTSRKDGGVRPSSHQKNFTCQCPSQSVSQSGFYL